ncbi:hypothetical protein ACQKII_02395 [Lysinibacillus sp. NPDC048646]|uniref:hypothetical protein n=1 Tax=Lysinibacillus sp. NPDC048646 TaxID=3390574 RepID=UPI003D078A4E
MRGLIKSVVILFCLILITAALIKNNQHSFKQSNQNDSNYVDKVSEKLQTSSFTKKQ